MPILPLIALAAATTVPLTATEVRRLPTADARQGVASGPAGLYAIDNRAIARLDPATGKQLARWDGDEAHFKHLNSCILKGAELVCAGSNYPDVPMESRIEIFDATTMAHKATRPIPLAYGSLTWADWHADSHGGSWWLAFANYDGRGGTPGRDHRFTTLVRTDKDFREIAHWLFPDAVLERFSPRSASGGTWGKDGLLYVTGHDRPELYALRVPAKGDRLELVATIAIPTDGQAIGWDAKVPRLLWGIERTTREIVASKIPEVAAK